MEVYIKRVVLYMWQKANHVRMELEIPLLENLSTGARSEECMELNLEKLCRMQSLMDGNWHSMVPSFSYVKPIRQRLKPLLKRFEWTILPFPKPSNAACLSDAPCPHGVSQEHTLEAAP